MEKRSERMMPHENVGNEREREVRESAARKILRLDSQRFDRIVNSRPDAMEQRRSDLLRIARALAILVPRSDGPASWIRARNSANIFQGKSAIELLESDPSALKRIRCYLEAEIHR